MKYLIDAQLPFRLSVILKEHGYDVIHTDDMPRKALSSDDEIRQRSFRDDRAVITKDADFLDSYYSSGAPKKLLIVTTGNISNPQLFELFMKNMEKIDRLFEGCSLIELTNTDIIEHE